MEIWMINPTQYYHIRTVYYSPQQNTRYLLRDDHYYLQFAQKKGRNKYTVDSVCNETTKQLPSDCLPVDALTETCFNCYIQHQYNMKKEVQPLDWFDHVASLPQYKQLMLRNINIVDENYIDKIKSQPVTLCTDGSVYSTTSGGGWVLATNDGTILVTVWNSDTAHYSYQNSYRSEAQAKLAGLGVVH